MTRALNHRVCHTLQTSPVIVSPVFHTATSSTDHAPIAQGIVFFSVINRVLRGVSHGDHPTAVNMRSMQINASALRTGPSGMTDSTRSFSGDAAPGPLQSHTLTLEKENDENVAVSDSPYSLGTPDVAKPMTFAVPEV